MGRRNFFLCALLAFVQLSACSPNSPKLEPKVFAQQVSDGEQLEFSPQVDILFVVDDSGSMSVHQDRLSKNIDSIVSSISASNLLDYHIGVITSTLEQSYGSRNFGGRLASADSTQPRFIDRNTPNGLKVLKKNLVVGIMGDTTEKFFAPVEAALTTEANAYNAGFARPDATLILIFITDTDDQSTLAGGPYQSEDFYNFLAQYKNGNTKKVIPYGILIPSGVTPGEGCNRDEYSPTKLEDVISRFNGFEYDLCDKNYNSNLIFIGKDIVNRASRYMFLQRQPIPSSITVKFGGLLVPNDLDNGWTFDAEKNAIVFGAQLIEKLTGTQKLEISYLAVPQ